MVVRQPGAFTLDLDGIAVDHVDEGNELPCAPRGKSPLSDREQDGGRKNNNWTQ
jgi:hypothetical protein